MQDIIIVCAGNYAKEMYYAISRANRRAHEKGEEAPWNILGFLDDVPVNLKEAGIQEPILGNIQDWHPIGGEVYGMGLGDPRSKERIAKLLKARGCRFASIIADYCIIPDDFVCGEGCMISAYRIGCCVKLGDFVNVNGSMLMSGAQIDDYSTTTGFTVIQKAKLEKRVFVGSHAVVLDDITIGSDAKISAGSIVMENVNAKTTVFGVPAREI